MDTDPRIPVTDTSVERVVDRTLDLIGVNTANPPGHTAELIDRLESELETLELATEQIVSDPAKPNLLTRLPGQRDEVLTYLGHADTVPFDADEWRYDPLGERRGERIYGRGATDMKGPLAAMIEVIHAYATTERPPPVTLELIVVSDEEVAGAAGLPTVLEEVSIDSAGCVIGETTCEGGRHSVTVADRGSIWLTLEARGEGAHGSRPMLGVNAIDRLYAAVERIRERLQTCRLEPPRAVCPILEESVSFYAPVLGEDTVRALFDGPSINLGRFEGGDTVNSVPVRAVAELDVRFSPGIPTRTALAELRSCVGECVGVQIRDVSWSVGTYEPTDSPLVEAVVTVAEAVSSDRVYRRSATGGGDAKNLRNAGVPTVEFAFGTDTVHSPDEHTTVDTLEANFESYLHLPGAFAERM